MLGDLFHVDDLIVMKSGIANFGDAKNANNTQTHHRQCLMSMNSLNVFDKDYSKKK